MSFEAHGSVSGSPTEQPIMEGGVIPEVEKPAPTPAPEPPKQKVGEPRPAQPAAAAPTPEVPAYAPNFKFKVMDKEHEIDEFVRAAIKDADSEKKIKEIYEKAYGLDVVKPRFAKSQEELKTTRGENENYKKSIDELRDHYKRDDMDSFFKALNVPEEKILRWVLNKANYEQLPPDQRQIMDAKRAAEQQAYTLQKENKSLQQQREEIELQARAQTLQIALEKPDISEFVKNFEAKAGKPGAFLQEIIDHGERTFYASKGKIDLTPEQAIKEVMERWSPFLGPAKLSEPPIIPANPGPGSQPPVQRAVTEAPKASTIPNVSGRQTAAISKAKPKSIEDLKKLYNTMANRA